MKLHRRRDGLYWMADGTRAWAEPLAGPFPTQEAAFTHFLVEQEQKLHPKQLGVWRVVHDAAREWWRGRRGSERDVLGALLTLMAGVRRNMGPATLCRLACGDQHEAWLRDILKSEAA